MDKVSILVDNMSILVDKVSTFVDKVSTLVDNLGSGKYPVTKELRQNRRGFEAWLRAFMSSRLVVLRKFKKKSLVN